MAPTGTPDTPPATLRLSPALGRVPAPDQAPAAPVAAPAAAPVAAPAEPAPAPAAAQAAQQAVAPAPPPPGSIAHGVAALRDAASVARTAPSLVPLTVALGGIALVSSIGWVIERRRNRRESDSVLWADVQPAASSIVTRVNSLDDILPDNPNPAEAARAIYVTAIGETNSRREATLIDLHQMDQKLQRRRKRGDVVAAVLLLQQHLVDFRYTSPWVFMELRELYKELALQQEWEVARDAFRARFGQNAPQWSAPSTADAQLLDDTHLCEGIMGQWPHRPARMWILRWMLGEHDMRVRAMGPPLLPLGVYRDLMLLDSVLDDAMAIEAASAAAAPAPMPSLTPEPALSPT